MSHPYRPRLSASSMHPRCYLGALVSLRAASPSAVAAREFRTAESTGPHWARLKWDAPVPLHAVTIVFPNGRVPSSWSITVEGGGRSFSLDARPRGDDGHTFMASVGNTSSDASERIEVTSLEVRQDDASDRGLRIAALIPSFVQANRPKVELCFDESMAPVRGDALAPWAAPLDVHDARRIRVDFGRDSRCDGLTVTVPRLGSVGLPSDVAEWAETIDAIELDGRTVQASAHLATVNHDEVTVSIVFPAQKCRSAAFALPPARGSLFAISAVDVGRAEGRLGAMARPLLGHGFAGSVGKRRDCRRVGITAAGTLQWRPAAPAERAGSVGLCAHGTLLLEGANGSVELLELGLVERTVRDGVALLRAGPEGAVVVTVQPTPSNDATFEVRVQGARPVGLRVVQADYLTCLTEPDLLAPDLLAFEEDHDGFRLELRVAEADLLKDAATGADLLRALGPARGTSSVANPVDAVPANATPANATPGDATLADATPPPKLSNPEWQAKVDALLVAAHHLERRDSSVTYGVFPSVYDGMVFGLEEDWLFYGLAAWGDGDRALRCLRATYLTETHLSTSNYLHDLRYALTPWQTERILIHTGRSFESLDAGEQRLVRSCGEWVVAELAKTAHASGEVGDDGVRVFPGLLPAFRFGGDLDFRTQSIYTSALAAVGLRALARLDSAASSKWASAAARLTDAVLHAFDAASTPDLLALHSGGGEAGSYYQLMAAGILHPVDFFARDDERAERLDRFMERDDRLLRGLPRFDDWGCERPGLDVHYAVGYLLRALRRGRRTLFVDALDAFFDAGDPATIGWREVSSATPGWAAASHLPARSLSRSEPCVGGVGVALQLLRHALVTERYGADGRPGGTIALFAGLPAHWFAASPHGAPTALDFPTFAGPVSLRCGVEDGDLRGTFDAPEADGVELVMPTVHGQRVTRAFIDGTEHPIAQVGEDRVLRAPAGRHTFVLELR